MGGMYKLRPYQAEAVQKTLQYFRKLRDPAVVVLPTGAGKSLVIAELARLAKGRVLVLAHVKELVEQNAKKFESYGLSAGIFSAGLDRKDSAEKVIFASIQSVANAPIDFFRGFTLVIIDECHRVSLDENTQYRKVLQSIQNDNPSVCILGLTATPYRMETGWIYNYSHRGALQTKKPRFFKQCVFELPISYMIQNKYLTPPMKVDIPVTCYDFSSVVDEGGSYNLAKIEKRLQEQRRLTPLIVKNIVDIANHYDRQGVMIFASTVEHAKEVLSYLPKEESELILGSTDNMTRETIINRFKEKEIRYLVNVSVLTTGFDAPHVDIIALLRPTQSVSLYQQIVGRGLRLYSGKTDCIVLDYAGTDYDLYSPEIGDKRPHREAESVIVPCPECGFENNFWGRTDDEGQLVEHYGRKCKGAHQDPETMEIQPCGFRFRFKLCTDCGAQNDISASRCESCASVLVDADTKLKQARLSKNAHVLIPEHIVFEKQKTKKGTPFLEVKYFDFNSDSLSEVYFLRTKEDRKKFSINFLRAHLRRPELPFEFQSIDEVIENRHIFRHPTFVIGRKSEKFWKITEKVFSEEILHGRNRRDNEDLSTPTVS